MPYDIQRTAPTVYLDQTGSAINGYRVTVYFPEFDETHFVQVPTLDPGIVQDAVNKLEQNRQALAALNEAPPAES